MFEVKNSEREKNKKSIRRRKERSFIPATNVV